MNYLRYMSRNNMIQLYLSILLSLVLSTSCANTNMSKQGVKSEESVSPELQLSDVDFSAEVAGRFYTYFRFVNQTSVPIHISYLQKAYDEASSQFIAQYHDAVDVIQSYEGFKNFGDSYCDKFIFFNKSEELRDRYIMLVCNEDYLSNDALWSEEVVDDNTIIRNFVITEHMYKEMKKIARKRNTNIIYR